jgi:hypothetical protein
MDRANWRFEAPPQGDGERSPPQGEGEHERSAASLDFSFFKLMKKAARSARELKAPERFEALDMQDRSL